MSAGICRCPDAWHIDGSPDCPMTGYAERVPARALLFGALFSVPLWAAIGLLVRAVR